MKTPLTKTTIIRGKKEKEREKITDKFTTIVDFPSIITESLILLSLKLTQETQKLSRPRLLTMSKFFVSEDVVRALHSKKNSLLFIGEVSLRSELKQFERMYNAHICQLPAT